MKRELKDSYSIDELVDIVKDLRCENGCPWDKVQTYETIKKCLRDETEEVCEAVDHKDMENLCEELGDVLLQVVFYAQMATEDGAFTFNDVVSGIAKKMVRRHPHVFGDEAAGSPEEALKLFKAAKAQEKKEKSENA